MVGYRSERKKEIGRKKDARAEVENWRYIITRFCSLRALYSCVPLNMTLSRKIDWFYFWYFVIHVPITVLIDSCLIIPKDWQFPIQKTLVLFHIAANNDFLLDTLPLWLQVFGLVELVFQLPLFIYAAFKLYHNAKSIYPWLIIYGFNASFTTLVCLVYVIAEGEAHGLTPTEVYGLFGLYLPYFLIPLFMLIDSMKRVLTSGTKQKLH